MTDFISGIKIKNKKVNCIICSKEFIVRAGYQDVGNKFVCSMKCKKKFTEKNYKREDCFFCGKNFIVKHSSQTVRMGNKYLYFCSLNCKNMTNIAMNKAEEKQEYKKVRKIAVFAQKGGTGKTTTALNLAFGLHNEGYRVLLIDADPQGSIKDSLHIEDSLDIPNEYNTLYDVFEGLSVKDVILKTDRFPDLILSDSSLNLANIELNKDSTRHKILREKISEIEDMYDYIIIDCSPALSVLNHNVLYMASEILVPISCDYLSMASIKQVIETINDVKAFFNHDLFILGFLPTFYIRNQNASKEVYSYLKEHYTDKVFPPIPETADIRLSAFSKNIVINNKKLRGSHNYSELINRVIKTIPKRENI